MFLSLLLVPASAQAIKPASGDPVTQAKTLRAAWLAMSQRIAPTVDLGPAEARLDVMEIEIEDAMAAAGNPRARVAALVAYLFKRAHFESSPDLADPANLYPHEVLITRKGYCLSLTVAVLAAAERLKLPLVAVAAPRHVFLRWQAGEQHFNIELTESGRLRPDTYYRERGITPEAQREGVYLAPLTHARLLAQLLNNEGYVHLRAGKVDLARQRLKQALSLDPRLPEAHVNAGVVAALKGEEKASADAFARAARWLPTDAGLDHDRALSALKSGNPSKALSRIEAALDEHPKDPSLLSLREAVLAALFEPRTWQRHQAAMNASGAQLFAADRMRRGFRGHYFDNIELRGKARERIDSTIDFEWRWNSPLAGIPADRFSVRWKGWVKLPRSGHWSIASVANDGVRLWIDGVRLIDDWNRNEGGLNRKTLELQAGWHEVRVEYFDWTRFAGIEIDIRPLGESKSLGASRVFHATEPQ